jgi:HSP20 family protein
MAIVHWDATRDFSLLQGDMNRLFERFVATQSDPPPRQRWTPAMDVSEEGDAFVLRADLPGMSESDISIEMHDRTLTIEGERRYERKPEHDGGFVRLERSYGKFQRNLTLPDGVEADAIDASFEHGVLELRIPKPVEAQPRRIEIGTRAARDVVEGEDASSDDRRSRRNRVLGRS